VKEWAFFVEVDTQFFWNWSGQRKPKKQLRQYSRSTSRSYKLRTSIHI